MEDKPRRKPGRPSKYAGGYEASFPDLAFRLALLGADDDEIANIFGIHVATINDWKNEHPEFGDALKRGKSEADGRVADSLYRRALGYSHADVDIRVVGGEIVQTPLTKHYPPDTVACIFWLKNRQRDKWRDKVETGVTDKDGNDVQMDPLELARTVAFLLTQGVAAQDAVNPHNTKAH